MHIIKKTPNAIGAYNLIQTWDYPLPPEGYAVWPEEVDTTDFYAYNGFVHLTFREEIIRAEDEEAEAEVIYYVTSCIGNAEAWEAWKASQPEPEPEPEGDSVWDELDKAYQEGVDSV